MWQEVALSPAGPRTRCSARQDPGVGWASTATSRHGATLAPHEPNYLTHPTGLDKIESLRSGACAGCLTA